MADWPPGSDSTLARTFGALTATTYGTTVAVTQFHTKDAWAPLVTAGELTFDAYGFLLGVTSSMTGTMLVDIGFGATNYEKVVLSNLMIESLANRYGLEVFIPLPIPAATVVSARGQANLGTGNVRVTITPLGQGFLPSTWSGHVETLGVTASTGETKGTLIDPGATINTKPTTFTTIDTLTRPCSMLLLMLGSRADLSITTCTWFLDIAIGAAGSEIVVYPDLQLSTHSSHDQLPQYMFGPYPFSAPAGTRISTRLQCSYGTSPDRTLNIAAYAFE